MTKSRLSEYNASFEDKKEEKSGHKVEVHFQDTEKDKYRKETFEGKSLPKVVDDALERTNEVIKDDKKELKFLGFPSNS